MSEENKVCRADAPSEERSSRSGGQRSLLESLDELTLSIQTYATATRRMAATMRRQNEVMQQLINQNAAMLEMLVQSAEEEAEEGMSYLDGTPIRKS